MYIESDYFGSEFESFCLSQISTDPDEYVFLNSVLAVNNLCIPHHYLPCLQCMKAFQLRDEAKTVTVVHILYNNNIQRNTPFWVVRLGFIYN